MFKQKHYFFFNIVLKILNSGKIERKNKSQKQIYLIKFMNLLEKPKKKNWKIVII